jgi:hypothetical protein
LPKGREVRAEVGLMRGAGDDEDGPSREDKRLRLLDLMGPGSPGFGAS